MNPKESEILEDELEAEGIEEDSADPTYDIATYPSDYTLSRRLHQMWQDKDIYYSRFSKGLFGSWGQSSL